jgi:hypothetical protein
VRAPPPSEELLKRIWSGGTMAAACLGMAARFRAKFAREMVLFIGGIPSTCRGHGDKLVLSLIRAQPTKNPNEIERG